MTDKIPEVLAVLDIAHQQAVYESFARYGGTWPEELPSGVMCCRGQRVTREDFKAIAAVEKLK
jgi:hypothetical protein